jgi:hypothetical protein
LSRYPQSGVGSLVYFFAGVASVGLGDRENALALFGKFLAIPPDASVAPWDAYRGAAQKLSAPQ